ncbi:MAG: hypothetical protein DLM50_04080 [Candidatus Meridianibacter frigidus]|nr:MAG: hypothetical protein DLM50_04080 [Candidatus Eremiobacteraeota bacterium]
MLAIRLIMTALCALGLYASVFMLRKARLGAQGQLAEPSVVQRPAARLFFGVSNAAFGIAFYVISAALIWIGTPWATPALLIAVGLAALTSVYLAYSLLFVTRMPCPFCWTGHFVNWLLALGAILLLHRAA